MRLKILSVIIICLFIGIAAGLIHIQVIKGNYYYNLSRYNRIRAVPLEGRRGEIYDRNGVVLATNRVAFDVMVVPQEITDKDKLFAYIAKVLGVTKDEINSRYEKKRLAPFIPVVLKEDIDRSTAVVFEENRFRFPGLMVRANSRRYYPFGDVGAHVLGYVGEINRARLNRLKDYGYIVPNMAGYSGVEEYYDSYLRGEDGGLQIEVNSRGEQVRLLGIKKAISGQSITLTIDSRIQQAAAELLKKHAGAIIVMNLENDEILGMVSSPTFDPNIFSGEKDKSKIQALTDPAAPLLNRAITGVYPPGSTFKIPVALAALDKGLIQPTTTFNCPGYYRLGRRRFRCSHAHGVQNLTEAIAHSCNTYFYNVGLLVGPDLIGHYARLLGLGSKTNVDLPNEEDGLVPSKEQKRLSRGQGWYDGDTLNLSIGQGDVLVTPIQLVRMMAKVARDGDDVYPHVLKSIEDTDIQEKDHWFKEPLNISQKTFDVIKGGLRGAVGDYSGTAHILDLKDIKVFGKTGTAQTSGGRPHHAWFVGFCPESKTKIVFCVFLEFGGSSHNACRLARALLIQLQKEGIL